MLIIKSSERCGPLVSTWIHMCMCVAGGSCPHLQRCASQSTFVWSHNLSTPPQSIHPPLVHKVETESPGALFICGRREAKKSQQRQGKVPPFQEFHTSQCEELSLIAAPWRFPSPAALISPMFPLWLRAPPNPGKSLQFIKLQWDRSSKLLPSNKAWRMSFYIIF